MTVFGTCGRVLMAIALAAGTVVAYAGQTAAPPSLQRTIWGVFPQSNKCGKSINLKVLSSEHTPDARFEGNNMVAGEIHEVWQATTCETRTPIRYLFRLAPDKKGALEIIGFERMLIDP